MCSCLFGCVHVIGSEWIFMPMVCQMAGVGDVFREGRAVRSSLGRQLVGKFAMVIVVWESRWRCCLC